MPSKVLLEELSRIRREKFGTNESGHFKPFQSDPESYANNVMKKPHEHFIDNSVFAYYLFQEFKSMCKNHPQFESLLTNIESVNDRTIFLLQNKISRQVLEGIVNQMMANESCISLISLNDRRFSFTNNLSPKNNGVVGTTESKDLASANEERMDGNRYFKCKQYEKALECYNKAILKCPTSTRNVNLPPPPKHSSKTSNLMRVSLSEEPSSLIKSEGEPSAKSFDIHSSSGITCSVIDIDPVLPASRDDSCTSSPMSSSSSTSGSSSSLKMEKCTTTQTTTLNGTASDETRRRASDEVDDKDKNDDKDDDDDDDNDQKVEWSEEEKCKDSNEDKRRTPNDGSDGKGMNHETLFFHEETSAENDGSCSMMDGVAARGRDKNERQTKECWKDVKEEQKKEEKKKVCPEGSKNKKREGIKNRNEDKIRGRRSSEELDDPKENADADEKMKIINGHVISDYGDKQKTSNHCLSLNQDKSHKTKINDKEDVRRRREVVIDNEDAKVGDEILPLLLANRSAVYLHLKHFEEAINDINEAINLGYRILDNHNIITRKITCLKFLGRDAEAERLYKETISLINREISSERIKLFWVEKLTTALNQIVPVLSINPPSKVIREDKVIKKFNDNLPSASEFVIINYTEDKGRHLKVTKDVKIGEVLIIDKPIGSVLANKYYCDYCNHCMVQLTNQRFIPCLTCSIVKYCSINCRNESWTSYHSLECPYLTALQLYPNGLHLLRILITCGINHCLDVSIDKESSAPKMFEYPKIGMKRNFQSFYSLLPKEMDSPEFNICYPLASAIYAIICLKMKLISRDQLLLFASRTLINSLLKISRNADTIFTHDFSLIIGSAVHTTSAMFNHDCDPNVYSYYVGNKVIHVAKKEISCGNEINVSYGVNYAFDPLFERQEFLSKSFLFECNCKRCKLEKDGVLICLNCKGPLMKTTFDTIACPSCDVTNDESDSMLLDPDHFIVNSGKNKRSLINGDGGKSILLNWSIFNYCSIM